MLQSSFVIQPRSDLDWCWYLRRQGGLGEALERVLHDIGVMHPGGWADWGPSRMTDTGSPVEMLFTGHETSLCLRTEVEDPSTDPVGRVERVCSLIEQLGGTPPPDGLRSIISAAQSSGPLQFGAWLGLRQCDMTLATTLYAEIPQGTADLADLLATGQVAPTLTALSGKIAPTMFSYDATSGEITLFFDANCAPTDIVPTLAKPANVSPDPLLGDIQVMIDAGKSFAEPTCDLSFSYTLHSAQQEPTLTLFVLAKGLFHNDSVIEAMVRDYPGNHMEAYAGLADQLFKAPEGQTHHGKIGLRAIGNDCPTLSLGVAAPWHCPVESS
jgi:hypothetical protein